MKFHEISTLPFGFHEIAPPEPFRNVNQTVFHYGGFRGGRRSAGVKQRFPLRSDSRALMPPRARQAPKRLRAEQRTAAAAWMHLIRLPRIHQSSLSQQCLQLRHRQRSESGDQSCSSGQLQLPRVRVCGGVRSGDYVEAAMDRMLSSIPQRTMMVNDARWSYRS